MTKAGERPRRPRSGALLAELLLWVREGCPQPDQVPPQAVTEGNDDQEELDRREAPRRKEVTHF